MKQKNPNVKKEKKPKSKRYYLTVISLIALGVILFSFLSVLLINVLIKGSVKENILLSEEIDKETGYDCILVLGCGVKADGSPSEMLHHRIETACLLYKAGLAEKILFSGDHGQENYDEVGTMMRVANEEFGVPLEDIFLDHAGFSTYETMARAATVFGVKRAIVVTQEYHLYRALYLAESYGIECVGVAAELRPYAGQIFRDLREVAARVKDLFSALFKPDFVGGDPISLDGDGRITHD